MTTHIINKVILLFFDKNNNKDDSSLPIVVGEQKESGIVNVIQTIAYPLGCYIIFFFNGSTPFRVFIFTTGPNARGKSFCAKERKKSQ